MSRDLYFGKPSKQVFKFRTAMGKNVWQDVWEDTSSGQTIQVVKFEQLSPGEEEEF